MAEPGFTYPDSDRHPVTGAPPDYYWFDQDGNRHPRWRKILKRGENPKKWWYTTGEVAARLGVTDQTVRNWIKAGYIKGNRHPGGRRLFVSGEAIEAFQKASRKPYG